MGPIHAQNLALGYSRKTVIRGIDLTIKKGEFLCVIGPSGVGKSTLLMGFNATTSVLEGSLHVLGRNLAEVGHRELKNIRARIGVIFQSYNLVSRLSVFHNIGSGMLHRKNVIPSLIRYYSREEYAEIYEYMKAVGMETEALSRCDRLSGGQKQRVAIARALAQKPEMILADEPVSSLDPVSARSVLETLKNANERYGITVVANLHQLDYAREYCHRVIGLNGGTLVYDGPPDQLSPAIIEDIYRKNPSVPETPEDTSDSYMPLPLHAAACRGVVL